MIDREAWLAALETTRPVDDQGAVTVREFAELMNLSERAARRRLLRLQQGGTVKPTSKRVRRFDGSSLIVQAYRLNETGA